MANSVLEVVEQNAPQSGLLDKDKREWVRVFRVFLQNNEHGPVWAYYGEAAVPKVGNVHPLDSLATVRRVSVAQVGDEPIYDVTVRYSTEWGGFDHPIQEPPAIRWGFSVTEEVVTHDVFSGWPITASTGELLVPGIEQEVYRLTLTLTRNEWIFNPIIANAYINKVNSNYTTVCGLTVAPGCALVKNLAGSIVHTNEWSYFSVEYQIEFKPDTYTRWILDHGTYYYDVQGNKQVFRDGGEMSMRPHLLNGWGGALPDGFTPVFLPYFTREQISFNGLGLNI